MFQKFSKKANSKPITFEDIIRPEQSNEHNRTASKIPFLRRQGMSNKTEDKGL
jgi:hypothetical protein